MKERKKRTGAKPVIGPGFAGLPITKFEQVPSIPTLLMAARRKNCAREAQAFAEALKALRQAQDEHAKAKAEVSAAEAEEADAKAALDKAQASYDAAKRAVDSLCGKDWGWLGSIVDFPFCWTAMVYEATLLAVLVQAQQRYAAAVDRLVAARKLLETAEAALKKAQDDFLKTFFDLIRCLLDP